MVATPSAHRICYSYARQILYSHSYRTAPPAAKPQVIRAPRWGAWLDCSTHVWASCGGLTVYAAAQAFWGAGLPRGERPDDQSCKITSPLNELVNFLKSWEADVWELANSVGIKLRAHSGLRRIETWQSLRIMPDRAAGHCFGHRKRSDFVSGFGVRHPEKAEPVLKLGPLERAACSNREIHLWAVPGSPTEGAKMIHKVEVHSISLIFLKFLSFSPVPLVWWCQWVHWASEFQGEALFTLDIKSNSIRSPAIKGGDLLQCQDDVLSCVECDNLLV